MAKVILAMDFVIILNNYKNCSPYFNVHIPLEYTFSDLIQIIKIYTGYGNKYDWNFIYKKSHWADIGMVDENDLEQRIINKKFDETRMVEYFENQAEIICVYGPMKFLIVAAKGEKKQTKTYPEMYNAQGFFPKEDKFKLGKPKFSYNDYPNRDFFGKDNLKDFDIKLKDDFKNKYKISDKLSECFDWKNVHKLKINEKK